MPQPRLRCLPPGLPGAHDPKVTLRNEKRAEEALEVRRRGGHELRQPLTPIRHHLRPFSLDGRGGNFEQPLEVPCRFVRRALRSTPGGLLCKVIPHATQYRVEFPMQALEGGGLRAMEDLGHDQADSRHGG